MVGHRGILKVTENNKTTGYYTHWGAGTVFSGFYRLKNAFDIKENQYPEKSISEIFGHLSYNGEYLETEDVTELVFEPLTPEETESEDKDFNTHGMLEMRVTLNLDENHALVEYNRFYHPGMGSFTIPIDHALHNVNLTISYAEERGITDFFEAAKIFEKGSGVYDLLLQSAQVKELNREIQEPYRNMETEELEVEAE
jgi:hypothetical protein